MESWFPDGGPMQFDPASVKRDDLVSRADVEAAIEKSSNLGWLVSPREFSDRIAALPAVTVDAAQPAQTGSFPLDDHPCGEPNPWPQPAPESTGIKFPQDWPEAKTLEAAVERSKDRAEEKPLLIRSNEQPAPPSDVAELVAEDGYKSALAALRQEAIQKCGGGFGEPDLSAEYQISLSLLVREVYKILNIEQHVDALRAALTALAAQLQQERERAERAIKDLKQARIDENDRVRQAWEIIEETRGQRDGEAARHSETIAERDTLAVIAAIARALGVEE